MTIKYNIPVTGRPNAGKTSLINYLTGSKRPVGKQAGTTIRIAPVQLIHDIYLVDLPGFGRITRRSKKLENLVKDQIVDFLDNSKNSFLFGIHVIDISTFHNVTKSLESKGIIPIDIEMIQFLDEITDSPPFVLLNKLDKVNSSQLEKNLFILQEYSLPDCHLFTTSFKTKEGCRMVRSELKSAIVKKLGSKYQKW
jgi:GTP-binding protein EngB required for normal cell division